MSIGTSLTSPYSMSWVGIDISNDAPLYLLAEGNPLSQQQAWFLGDSKGSPWPTTLLNATQSQYWKPGLVLVASPSPSLLGGLIRIIIIYFIKFSLYCFSTISQMPLSYSSHLLTQPFLPSIFPSSHSPSMPSIHQ